MSEPKYTKGEKVMMDGGWVGYVNTEPVYNEEDQMWQYAIDDGRCDYDSVVWEDEIIGRADEI